MAPAAPANVWGGLVSGYLTHRFAAEAEGSGVDALNDAFHNRRGVIRPAVPVVKTLSSITVLATGGSAGKEGPVAQIGAGLGSWIGERLGLSAPHRRILLLAGAAGGLGAIFRAPLGGAITSVEVLYKEDFESEALIPCVISSIVAYSIYTGLFGFSHIFDIPELAFTDVRELFIYLALGILCACVGMMYVTVFAFMRDRIFRRIGLPRYVVVGLGGALVGLIGLLDVRILGTGFGIIQQAISGELGLRVVLLLILLKIVATSCTVGSGAAGGVLGPAVFIGAMLGGAVGVLGQQYFPNVVQQPGAYVIVGMAGFLACVANTPLAALIIVTEMTGSYDLLPPLMLVCAIALVFARGFSLFEKQVQNRFHSPAHIKDITVNVLKNRRVDEVLSELERTSDAIVTNNTPYVTLNALARRVGHLHFVIVDDQGALRGMLALDDLYLPEDDQALKNLILVEDLLIETVEPIEETDDLHVALEKLLSCEFDKLPVVRRAVDAGRVELLGYLMYSDLLRLYDNEVRTMDQME